MFTKKNGKVGVTGLERVINRESYERQKGIYAKYKEHFEIEEMEADHIDLWHEGRKTTAENCQMLCKQDNRTKSGK